MKELPSIETVARAMLLDRCKRYPQQDEKGNPTYPDGLDAWIDLHWKVCVNDAQAAISAIFPPTNG